MPHWLYPTLLRQEAALWTIRKVSRDIRKIGIRRSRRLRQAQAR